MLIAVRRNHGVELDRLDMADGTSAVVIRRRRSSTRTA